MTSLWNGPAAILAGMWGTKLDSSPEIRKKWSEAWINGIHDDDVMWKKSWDGADQAFLEKFVEFHFI